MDGRTQNDKILQMDQLDQVLAEHRARGDSIVMTNGCYDMLHPGHIASLQFARGEGDLLVVGLNSDRSIRELKGPDRPIFSESDRAAMLAALECVDYVVIFDDASVLSLVERILPDVLVKSAQYAVHEVVGHEIVLQNGGRIALAPMTPGISTTDLVQRLAG